MQRLDYNIRKRKANNPFKLEPREILFVDNNLTRIRGVKFSTQHSGLFFWDFHVIANVNGGADLISELLRDIFTSLLLILSGEKIRYLGTIEYI